MATPSTALLDLAEKTLDRAVVLRDPTTAGLHTLRAIGCAWSPSAGSFSARRHHGAGRRRTAGVEPEGRVDGPDAARYMRSRKRDLRCVCGW